MKLAGIVLAFLAGLPFAKPSCIVPDIAYSTLPKLFTINVLYDKSVYYVYLNPGRFDTYNKPLTSSVAVNPPVQFNLTKGVLYTSGHPAYAHYVPPPPHPTTSEEMLFGGSSTTNEQPYYASYDCDAYGKQYLALHTQQGFNVGGLGGGAELYITPNGYAGRKLL